MATKEELLSEYRKLAKRADQRLVRLEKLAEQEHFKGSKEYAYARAMRDIRVWSGDNANRFNTKPPENVQQLQAKINDIIQFLEAPSSTKKGIVTVYSKRAETFNRNHGTDFTWQELATFWESTDNKKLRSKEYASSTIASAVSIISQIDANKKATLKNIKDVVEKNKKIDDTEQTAYEIKMLLEQNPKLSTHLKRMKK